MRAVISEPDSSAASTTSVPREMPAISRLRRGKLSGTGGAPSGYSLATSPCWLMRRIRSECCGG